MLMRSVIAGSLVVLAAVAVFAQNGTGTIRGVVNLPADGPVARVTVQAKSTVSGRIFTAESGPSGQFTLANLPQGTYEVSVPPIGLTTDRFVQRNVSVAPGQITALDITLRKGNLGVIGDDNAFLTVRSRNADVRGPMPRMPDGHPDLSGVWNGSIDPNPDEPSLMPWAVDVLNRRRSTAFRDHPDGFCLPGDPTPTIALLDRKSV